MTTLLSWEFHTHNNVVEYDDQGDPVYGETVIKEYTLRIKHVDLIARITQTERFNFHNPDEPLESYVISISPAIFHKYDFEGTLQEAQELAIQQIDKVIYQLQEIINQYKQERNVLP